MVMKYLCRFLKSIGIQSMNVRLELPSNTTVAHLDQLAKKFNDPDDVLYLHFSDLSYIQAILDKSDNTYTFNFLKDKKI